MRYLFLTWLMMFMPFLLHSEEKIKLKSIEVHGETSLDLDVYKDNKIVRDESKVSFAYGIKTELTNFSAIYGCSFPSTKFSVLKDLAPGEIISRENRSWGMRLAIPLPVYRTELSAGTLKFSGSITRLKNPVFSSISPLKVPSFFSCGTNAALPSWTSSSSEKAIAVNLVPDKNFLFLPSVQFSILEGKNHFLSLSKRFSTTHIPSALICSTLGLFSIGHELNESWYQDRIYLPERKNMASELCVNFRWPNFIFSSALGIHETPFGKCSGWIKTQDHLIFGNFTLGLFYYKGDRSLVTASGSTPRVVSQIFLNPQYRFYLGKSAVAAGIGAGNTKKETKERVPFPVVEKTVRSSVSFKRPAFSILLSADTSRSTEDDFPDYGSSVKVTVPAKKITATSTLSFKNEDDIKNTFDFSQKISFRKSFIKYMSLGFEIKENNGNYKFNATAAAEAVLRSKKLIFSGKIKVQLKKNENL